MEQNLSVVEELRAKLAEKPLDMEMIAGLKAALAAQPIDAETAAALKALLVAQALNEEMMAELNALKHKYMPDPPMELSDEELDAVAGGLDWAGETPPPPLPPEVLAYEQYRQKSDFIDNYCRQCGKTQSMAIVGFDYSFWYEKCEKCAAGYKAPWSWL